VDAPVATYAERRFDGRRLFELYTDRIAISGTAFLGARFELNISLDALAPDPDRLWARPNGFWSGVGMFVVFSTGPSGFASVLSPWWKGLSWVLAAGGLLLALATSRRIEWAVFRNAAGVELLTIARAGPSRDNFQVFVDAVRGAIQARARELMSSGAGT
jgi:hypothetical protein